MIPPLKRSEIARILRRHRGAQVELGRRAGVGRATIASWLNGSTSKNIADNAEIYARELLLKEEAERIAKKEANGPSARAVLEQYQATKTIPPGLKKNPTEE